MDPYHFRADLLDTFQSAPDAIKALALIVPPLAFVVFGLGLAALLLHHRRADRQIERDYEDLREARQIQRERWLHGGDPDFRRRLEEAFQPRPADHLPDRLADPLAEHAPNRLGLLGRWPKDGEDQASAQPPP